MDKKELILRTALNLFVENGFHGTATSKIASEAGVANGTLFNYFRTKEELIIVLFNSVLKEMDDFIIKRLVSQSISKESFRSLFISTITWSLENPIHWNYLQQFTYSPYFKLVDLKIISKEEHPLFVLIKNGIDLVLIKQMPILFIHTLFMSQINGLYYYIFSNDLSTENRSELIDETFEMVWKMIEE